MAYIKPESIGKPEDDLGWLEPESPANEDYQPEYPFNNVTLTESGHSFEMDDTPERERIRLTHRTGTFIEMHPNGDEVHKVYGDGYEITVKNKNILIEGHCNITINGDSVVNVKGNKIERIEGNYDQEILGNLTQVVKKKAKILSEDDMTIGANANFGGALRLSVGDHLYLSGDLFVGGELVADKIASLTRIDAGTGVNAGPLGFVSVLGGLSIGVPVAVPGSIICLDSMYAGISVNAPLANFGVMESIWMTDIVNTSLYNAHTHPSFRGPTGPPLLPMV